MVFIIDLYRPVLFNKISIYIYNFIYLFKELGALFKFKFMFFIFCCCCCFFIIRIIVSVQNKVCVLSFCGFVKKKKSNLF